MENRYWTGRKRRAMQMASEAATSEARLIHYDLAGRYSIKADQFPPFAAPISPPGTRDERPVLHLHRPDLRPPVPLYMPADGKGS
jgi:hypothetical protein